MSKARSATVAIAGSADSAAPTAAADRTSPATDPSHRFIPFLHAIPTPLIR
jgi:hypothetical protein